MGGHAIPPEENADLLGFTPEHAHLLLQGVYGDFLHHSDRLHLDRGISDNAAWKRRWHRIAAQSASCYDTPSGAVGHHFTEILAAGWRGVLAWSWNSERTLVFAHVFLTKTLGVRRAQNIRARITRGMDLWKRGQHAGLVRDAKAEGAAQEGRAASGGGDEDDAVARSFHEKVLSGKLRQDVRLATDREGGGVSPPG